MLDAQGRIVGAVEVFSNNAKYAHALETIRKLQSESLQDALTGLGNRRFADLNLESMLHGAKDHNVPFGLLFVDIDHFKKVNDTWGHGVGDKVLRMVAQTLANGVRPLDVPCRWGGEEFVVLLPNVDREALAAVAERLRVLVENSWLDEGEETITVTASFGGAISRAGDNAESLVGRADAMVYQSKASGRNCLRIEGECVA
jgi:diguanylate cyclase (GGDEF)-like protein